MSNPGFISTSVSRAVQIFKDRGIDVDLPPNLGRTRTSWRDHRQLRLLATPSPTGANRKIIEKPPGEGDRPRRVGVDKSRSPATPGHHREKRHSAFDHDREHQYLDAVAAVKFRSRASTQAGSGRRTAFMGVEINRKTRGVIGCGNIGRSAAEPRRPSMYVVAFVRPVPGAPRTSASEGRLDELFKRAFTHLQPATEKTRNIIDAAAIHQNERGGISLRRGGLVASRRWSA